MAHMIPDQPKEFTEASKEGEVFEALSQMSDEYYVFHSVSLGTVSNNTFYDREIDFLIACPRGILVLEVKAGHGISYRNRSWYYSGGGEMSHNGPYYQAATAKRVLKDKMAGNPLPAVRVLAEKCRFLHGVVFTEMSKTTLFSQGLPEEADEKITLCLEDMLDPEVKINKIFNMDLPYEKYDNASHTLTDKEFQLILDYVLCPHFNLIPSPKAADASRYNKMKQMLREQYLILDFLDEQDSAVINGAAGTGKTMLAVEKARRHSVAGEKTLFLCYNKMLCEELNEKHKRNTDKEYTDQFENVDFMTISRLAKLKTGDFTDFEGLLEWLLDCADKKQELGYKHIIVDEGQDFGMLDAQLEESGGELACSIIDGLQEAASKNGGTFYLFYDKYQMVQGGESINYQLPDCIQNSDCRLTLHRNCRNTHEIAQTSVTPLKDRKNRTVKSDTAYSWELPVKPVIHLYTEVNQAIGILNETLATLQAQGISDIVILSVKPTEYSFISGSLHEKQGKEGYLYYSYGGMRIPVTSCIKFKGLEADAVILTDLDKTSFAGKRGLNFYVGASRARLRLAAICLLKEEDYYETARSIDTNVPKRNDPNRMRAILGSLFGADMQKH